MDYQNFKMVLDAIKKHRNWQDKVTKFIEAEICTDSWAFVTVGDDLCDTLLKVLENIFNDKGKWIDWWLYEDVEKIVYLDNNETIDITKPEDLYKFLLENKNA